MVNCDWDVVRAVDLYAVLRSFLPAGGRIESVAVYPSAFGEQRMAEEATSGPAWLMIRKQSCEAEAVVAAAVAREARGHGEDGGVEVRIE